VKLPASRFLPVASVEDIPDHGTLSVTLPDGTPVCLVRHGDEVSAFRDECPHQGMPLSAGEVLEDGTLECAWHGARFDCRTGAVLRGPAEEPANLLDVRVEHGQVLMAPGQ
jgi:3-phenylpropionate/trans-cinnamate dioxygenase ferredoxin subunit